MFTMTREYKLAVVVTLVFTNQMLVKTGERQLPFFVGLVDRQTAFENIGW